MGYTKFEASLGYARPCLKKNKTKQARFGKLPGLWLTILLPIPLATPNWGGVRAFITGGGGAWDALQLPSGPFSFLSVGLGSVAHQSRNLFCMLPQPQ